MADVVVTEAGFGDLVLKILRHQMSDGWIKPDAVVLAATVRALKYNGESGKSELSKENLDALRAGIVNLENILKIFRNITPVVSLNRFVTDTEAELNL